MRNNIAKPFSWYSNNIDKIIFRTCLLTIVVLFIERIFLIFSYEGHLAGIDNNFDFPIIRYLAGYSIYPNPNSYPFIVNPYAPIFFIVCKWIASFLNITAEDTITIYRISRSVAFFADAATCLLFFSLLRTLAKYNKTRALITTTLFYTVLCYLGYTFNRSDCLFLFFYSCTLFLLFSNRLPNKTIKSILLALFATLTIFSKQNGVSLLLLVPVWMLLNKDFKQLIQFLLFSFIFLFGAFYYFQYIFTDHTFAEHIFHALKNKIDIHWFYVYIFKLLADSPLILPLTIATIIAIKVIAENINSFLSRLGILFLIQLLFSTGLSFKWGASLGYFNECYFIGFIIIAICHSEFTVHSDTQQISTIKTIGTFIYPALLIFLFHVTLQFYFYFLNDKAKTKSHFDEQVVVSNYLKKELDNKNNYVLDLNSPNVDFFKNLLFKESVAPNFDAINCCTMPDKIFDYHDLLNGLQNGRIRFLIEKKGHNEESLWGIKLNNYKVDTTMFDYTIYKFDPMKEK